jgi:hypothetical protein
MARKKRTDEERLNWLSKQEGIGIISDDYGHWTATWTGIQTVSAKAPADISTSFWIEKHEWKKTLRGAIDAAMAEDDK